MNNFQAYIVYARAQQVYARAQQVYARAQQVYTRAQQVYARAHVRIHEPNTHKRQQDIQHAYKHKHGPGCL